MWAVFRATATDALHHLQYRATQAHFTPDGHIIYTRVTPGGRTLWLINADGSNGTPIPAGGELIRTHGDWQPIAS